MAVEKDKVVKLAVDAIQNKVKIPDQFSKNDTSDVLREAFIEANGGSTKITHKTFRKNPELFEIIETIIPYITVEGLQGNEFFMNKVDYRNLALGDDEEFWTEDQSLFLVADAAQGTQAIRRQRLNVGTKVTIDKTLKVIKVYEELNRLLAGRVDFNMFVDRLGKSMTNEVYNDVYTAFNGISSSTSGMSATYYKSGTFAEDTLLELIDHVEAGTGMTAQLIGTRSALRKITTAVVSDEAKSSMYNIGYYGKFNGTDMLVAKQRHTIGTDTFILDDSKVYVVAGEDKFIKLVDEGEGLLVDGDVLNKPDMTKEYLYGQMYGVGLIINQKLGVFDIS